MIKGNTYDTRFFSTLDYVEFEFSERLYKESNSYEFIRPNGDKPNWTEKRERERERLLRKFRNK